MTIFSHVPMAPADPILGLTEAFKADDRENKVNLGVGAYQDDSGKVPLMDVVRRVTQQLVQTQSAWTYQPIDGSPGYNYQVRSLVFDGALEPVTNGRVITAQALGGTGALKIGADLLAQVTPQSRVYISSPTWANHRGIFEGAGFDVTTYRYFDADQNGVDVEGMLEDLTAAQPGSIVILHACCHNPTGYDLTHEQWTQVIDVICERRLIPFLDMAYQGFGEGVTADAHAVRAFAERVDVMFIASSFSKNLGLYGERVGALSIMCTDPDEASRVQSQLKRHIRRNYSNPPSHGATIVANILADDTLRSDWYEELAAMRTRMTQARAHLVEGLEAAGVDDMGHIANQQGMFSFTGLTPEQMQRLRNEFAIYGTTDNGRICVAALNSGNLDYVVESIAAVRREA